MMPQKDYEESFSNFLEAVVFDYAYDPSLKLALKREVMQPEDTTIKKNHTQREGNTMPMNPGCMHPMS